MITINITVYLVNKTKKYIFCLQVSYFFACHFSNTITYFTSYNVYLRNSQVTAVQWMHRRIRQS